MVDPKLVKKGFKFVKNGDIEEVEEMLGDGSLSPNEQDKGRDILSVAVENAHSEIVEILLQKGANPDSTNRKGKSSLAVAYENDMPDIFELLLNSGTDPNVPYEKTTLLAATLSDDATEYSNMLLTLSSKKQKRIDPNHVGKDGLSNLHYAIVAGHNDLALSLLAPPYNADVGIASKGGAYPAHIAASHGMPDVLKALVARDSAVLTQAHRESTDSILMTAVEAAQVAAVDACLALKFDVNYANRDGVTALHFATYNDDRMMVEKLLQSSADVNALTTEGHSPLDYIAPALHDAAGGTAEVLVAAGGKAVKPVPVEDDVADDVTDEDASDDEALADDAGRKGKRASKKHADAKAKTHGPSWTAVVVVGLILSSALIPVLEPLISALVGQPSLFSRLDANGDKKITDAELRTWYRATHNDKDVPDAMVRQWYSQDRNRDGSIQEKEFRFNE